MDILKLEDTELEIKFTDIKIQENTELVELFNKTHINIEWFMQEFRKCLINQNFHWLLQHAYNNFEPRNQSDTFGGFDVLSRLLKMIDVNISWENLLSQAKSLKLKKEMDMRVQKLNKVLDWINNV